MKITASEFISKAEGLKQSEISTRQRLEQITSERSSVHSEIQKQGYKLESLMTELENLRNSTSEENDNSSQISNVMAKINEVKREISDLKQRDNELERDQQETQGELNRIEQQEQQTLADIQDSAARANQNIQLVSSFGGDYGNVASQAAGGFRQSLGQLTQAAAILGGSVAAGAAGGGAGARTGRAGGAPAGAGRNFYEAANNQRNGGKPSALGSRGGSSRPVSDDDLQSSSGSFGSDDATPKKSGGLGRRRTASDLETHPETLDRVNTEKVGEFAPSYNPYQAGWDDFAKEFGSEGPDWDSFAKEFGTDGQPDWGSMSDFSLDKNVKKTGGLGSRANRAESNGQQVTSGKKPYTDEQAKQYCNHLKDYLVNNGLAKNVDFSGFDPHVAYDVGKAVYDAKTDFPDLEIGYLGSIDQQVSGIHDTIESGMRDYYKKCGFDDNNAGSLAKKYADDYVKNNKLNDTSGTYAWSLRSGNTALEKYDGVAVNGTYAKDYSAFRSSKSADEVSKWSPVGCGTPKAVADHELGHEIDRLLNASNDTVINDLYSEMIKNNNAESTLSGYSKKNVKEFIAEAYSEYRNNPAPRDTAKAVYNRLIELRDQKKLVRVLKR